MREIRTSGLMSGEGKRTAQAAPRLSSTLLFLNALRHVPSTEAALAQASEGIRNHIGH
jgi:hypothetical protein